MLSDPQGEFILSGYPISANCFLYLEPHGLRGHTAAGVGWSREMSQLRLLMPSNDQQFFLFPDASLFRPCLQSWVPAQSTPSLEGLDQVSVSQVLRGLFHQSQVSADEETSAYCICSRSLRAVTLFIMHCVGPLHSQCSGSIDIYGVAASEAEPLRGSAERAEMEPCMLSAFSREGYKLWDGGIMGRWW